MEREGIFGMSTCRQEIQQGWSWKKYVVGLEVGTLERKHNTQHYSTEAKEVLWAWPATKLQAVLISLLSELLSSYVSQVLLQIRFNGLLVPLLPSFSHLKVLSEPASWVSQISLNSQTGSLSFPSISIFNRNLQGYNIINLPTPLHYPHNRDLSLNTHLLPSNISTNSPSIHFSPFRRDPCTFLFWGEKGYTLALSR